MQRWKIYINGKKVFGIRPTFSNFVFHNIIGFGFGQYFSFRWIPIGDLYFFVAKQWKPHPIITSLMNKHKNTTWNRFLPMLLQFTHQKQVLYSLFILFTEYIWIVENGVLIWFWSHFYLHIKNNTTQIVIFSFS